MSLFVKVFIEVLFVFWVVAAFVENSLATDAVVEILVVLDLGVALGTGVTLSIASLNQVLLAVDHFRVFGFIET